jgi:hypothetical protein
MRRNAGSLALLDACCHARSNVDHGFCAGAPVQEVFLYAIGMAGVDISETAAIGNFEAVVWKTALGVPCRFQRNHQRLLGSIARSALPHRLDSPQQH